MELLRKFVFCNLFILDQNDVKMGLGKVDRSDNMNPRTPNTASMVPQLWNPRHMLGFEEFKVKVDFLRIF